METYRKKSKQTEVWI